MASVREQVIWGLLNALQPNTPPADIPLIGVKASCLLLNTLAEVTITQRYKNTSSNPIQAIYVFPIDDEAAVSGFTAHLGQRTVRGVIKEKEQARQEYQAALDEGHGAALLETAGTGALKIQLGNLAAGCEAEIRLIYSTVCPVEGDSIVLKIPTTIKQRYMPIEALQTSDAASQQPSYSSSVSYGLSLDVDIFMSGPIINVSSSTHPLSVSNDPDDSSHCQATLGVEKVAMDGDVLVRVKHSDVHKPVVFLSSQAEVDGGSAGLMLSFAPQFEESQDFDDEVHEFVFLVDRSGSMGHGGRSHQHRPIDQCRNALQLFLRSLPEGCQFNIVGFGSTFTKLFSSSRAYDAANLDEASRHVAAIDSNMGGTEILQPLKAILAESGPTGDNVCKGNSKLMRKLFLLTDGAVGNTQEVIRTVKENAGHTRVFTFGVGDGAASDLVNGVARAGRGEACFIRHGEPIDEKVITQLGKAMAPVLEDVSIDWGILQVEEQSPAKDDLAPVFNNTPYTVLALLSKDSQHQGQVVLSGKLNGKAQRFEVNVTPWTTTRTDCRILHSLAAKQIIRDLQERVNQQENSKLEKKMLALSLRFEVASSQASFVAVEEREGKQDGVLSTVQVPLCPSVPPHMGFRGGGGGRGGGVRPPGRGFISGGRGGEVKMKHKKCQPRSRSAFEQEEKSVSQPSPRLYAMPVPKTEQSRDLSARHVRMSAAVPAPRSAPSQSAMCSPRSNSAAPSSHAAVGADPLQMLTLLQDANGSWQLDDSLAKAVQLPKASILAAQPADISGEFAASVWATAVAIAFLQKKCAEKRAAFSLLEKKAKKWMSKQDGVSSEKVSELISCADCLF